MIRHDVERHELGWFIQLMRIDIEGLRPALPILDGVRTAQNLSVDNTHNITHLLHTTILIQRTCMVPLEN